ncbi:unnamed protein product [Rotaria magnacalcarata]
MNGNETSTTMYNANSIDHMSTKLPHTSTLQSFGLVWLDLDVHKTNQNICVDTIKKFKKIVYEVHQFTDSDECVDFIKDIQDASIFMILSGISLPTTIPIIHDIPQINTICLLSDNHILHQDDINQYKKVKLMIADVTSICDKIHEAVSWYDQNLVSMSCIPISSENYVQNLDHLDPSFMYTEILKEILLTIDFERKHFDEFISYCSQLSKNNEVKLSIVDKFNREYHEHAPIWWYTSQRFLYSMLNQSLRLIDVDLIIRMGFFIRDLHNNITELHTEQYPRHMNATSFTVYRGQGLSQTQFDQIIENKNGLLSFNHFLSTSLDQDVSRIFAESQLVNPDVIGVIFEISVNTSISNTAFAKVNDISHYEHENEMLFTMNSIFRIGLMKSIDGNNRLWNIDLTLTNEKDLNLQRLTEYMRNEISSDAKGWDRLGMLLIRLGQLKKAQEVYEVLLHQSLTDPERAHIYHQLGIVKNGQFEHLEAISYYRQSMEIMQKVFSPTDKRIVTSYCNTAAAYASMGDYSNAMLHYKLVLKLHCKTCPKNYSHLPPCYNNIGSLYHNMGEYSTALLFLRRALDINQNQLPPNHPDLAISYRKIGAVYEDIHDYSNAFSFYQKALEIEPKALPLNHSNLATACNNIDTVNSKIKN